MPRKKPNRASPPPSPSTINISVNKSKDAPSSSEKTGLKLVLRKDKNESSWSVASPTTATTTNTTKTSQEKQQVKEDDDKIPPIRIPKITIKTKDMILNRELTAPLTTKSSPSLAIPATQSSSEREHKSRRNSLEESSRSKSSHKRKSDVSVESTSKSIGSKRSRRDSEDEAKPSSKDARKKKESPRKGIEDLQVERPDGDGSDGRKLSLKKIGINILNKLIRQDKYAIFYEPVLEKDVPDYYQIIKNPMDFTTLRGNLNRGDYATLGAFEVDLLRIFANAMIYNRPGTIYYEQAKSFHAVASQLVDANRSKVDSQKLTPSTTPTTSRPTTPTRTPTPTPMITPTPPTERDVTPKRASKTSKDETSQKGSKSDEKKARRRSDEKTPKRKKGVEAENGSGGITTSTSSHLLSSPLPPPPQPPPIAPQTQSPQVELPGGFSDLVDGQVQVKKRGRPLGSKNKGPRRRPGEESGEIDSSPLPKKRKSKKDAIGGERNLDAVDSMLVDPLAVMSSPLSDLGLKKQKISDIEGINSPSEPKPLASAAKASIPITSPLTPKPATTANFTQPSPTTTKQKPVITSPSLTPKASPSAQIKPRKVYVPSSVVSPTTKSATTKPSPTSTQSNSTSYNMYISKRATPNGTPGSLLHSPINNNQANNYINSSKPKPPTTTAVNFSNEKAYRASLEMFVKSLGKSALDQVAKFISSMRTTPIVIQSQLPQPSSQPLSSQPQNRISLSQDILYDLKSITDDSIDTDALQEMLTLRNDGVEIVETIAAKILENDTYRFLGKMQEEYGVNNDERIEMDESSSKVQEILDNNFEMLCALQMQQYQRLSSSPNDTEVKLVSQLSDNLKQLSCQVEPGILVDLQTIQAKLNTFRARLSFTNQTTKTPPAQMSGEPINGDSIKSSGAVVTETARNGTSPGTTTEEAARAPIEENAKIEVSDRVVDNNSLIQKPCLDNTNGT